MSDFFTGGIGALAGVGTTAASMIGQKKREQRQVGYQKDLMGVQFQNQQKLNQQGKDLQMQMWKDTNAPAQVKMLEAAGLNPGLMYGGGGAGGSTGGQTGGSAASGAAPSTGSIPMEIQAGLAAAKLMSEIDLNKAVAEEKVANAESTRGAEGTVGAAQIESSLAGALNAKSQARLNELGFEIGNATKGDQIDKAMYEVDLLAANANLSDEQANLAREKAASEGISRQLMKSGIEVNQAQIDKMIADVQQGWGKLDAQLQQIQVGVQGNKLRALEGQADLQAIQNNFILGEMGKQIDLMKLNVEQQKIFVSLFGSILNRGTGTSVSETYRETDKGVMRSETRTRKQ